jgi:wobble nucleotide-excising tRNase
VPEEEIKSVLEKQLEGILNEAEERTKNHIKNNLDIEGETWIQKGLGYIKDDGCPFCGQNCDHNDLIEAYRGYFDKEYHTLKDEISGALRKIKNLFSESAIIFIQRNYNLNEASANFWNQYLSFKMPELSFDDIQKSWKNVRELLVGHLDSKNLSPLEKIALSADLITAIASFKNIQEKVKNYNEEIDKINETIQKEKLKAGSVDLLNEERELETLKNTKIRHSEKVKILCDEYQTLLNEKKNAESKKKEARVNLDQYTKDVFDKYQEGINKHLGNLGADFSIAKTETSYIGGKPSSSYCIKINNISVNLGDASTYGEPCFRNLLSQGDKNCLAFAFFISKLEQDEEIAEKVLVFDDPISSLDGHRRSWTKDRILEVSNKSKQSIVMSHDRYFLRDIYDGWRDNEIKPLCIFRDKKASKMGEWDIISETLGGYFNDFYKILNFIDNGIQNGDDLRSVAACVRPVLEGYLRTKFPKDFSQKECLGKFISKAEKSVKGENLYLFPKESLKELGEINNYCKKYHHKENPSADAEVINEGELKSFCTRAVTLIGN